MELTVKDLETLKLKGKTEEQLKEELRMLKEGFPYLKIEAAATPGHGIFVLDEKMENQAMDIWNEFLASGAKVTKMVPASGAASRMFKDLFSFANGKDEKPSNDFMKKFFNEIEKFAFFNQLNETCIRLYGKSIDSLVKEKRYKDVVKALIDKEGLNYGQLPKALLSFHKYLGGVRTAIEEHLSEGAQYAGGKDGNVNVHFTVSEDHIPLVERKFEEAKGKMEHEYGVKFDLSTSIQKPSTDTVAANLDGTPYKEKDTLFFRPGGHGALIENLNDLNADVIFIKNIDNVVPENKREDTVKYKKIIGGVLVGVKQKGDDYCKLLSKGTPDESKLNEILDFVHKVLCISHDGTDKMTPEEKAEFLYKKLNRPYRVCGMVRNEGEPGGGPFLAYNADGTVSPQILESTQIDPHNKEAQKMMKEATHFNPVDLVISTKSWDGKKFNLPEYVDKTTGFISQKSREGVEIKALELPGLWNGAMSDWNTLLVEVPLSTFNPVKTVNDLLRDAHQ
ncbi:MAG: DUF4301 family protein [Muribaculaceae bacterium]|nr:DUF4301 family protein [Muribaculaceae bacterium]